MNLIRLIYSLLIRTFLNIRVPKHRYMFDNILLFVISSYQISK